MVELRFVKSYVINVCKCQSRRISYDKFVRLTHLQDYFFLNVVLCNYSNRKVKYRIILHSVIENGGTWLWDLYTFDADGTFRHVLSRETIEDALEAFDDYLHRMKTLPLVKQIHELLEGTDIRLEPLS